MTAEVLSEVSAVVTPEREGELVAAYRGITALPLPDGLIRTELLHGDDGRWRILSLWRDRAALDAVRADTRLRAAPHLFEEVGAAPELAVYRVAARRYAPVEEDWAAA